MSKNEIIIENKRRFRTREEEELMDEQLERKAKVIQSNKSKQFKSLNSKNTKPNVRSSNTYRR